MLDFNDAGPQNSFDVIPDGTVVVLQATVKPGGAGQGGWTTPASTAKGNSEGLDLELTVVDGEHAKRKIFVRLTISGTGEGHRTAAGISHKTLCAILESARGIRPDDETEAAKQARRVASYGDFNGLRFIARLGVLPPKDGYKAKNTIDLIITPDMPDYQQPQQVAVAASSGTGATAAPTQGKTTGATGGGEIARPQWAT
jgi:hypothetical protein